MIADRIQILLSQENSSAYAVRNYLEGHCLHHSPATSEPVDDTCRLKMVDWLYAIVDTCQLRRSAVPIAMTYVDRLLSNPLTYDPNNSSLHDILQDRNRYQLVVMTCLYTAVKLHEQQIISPELLSKLSLGRYSIQDIEEEELNILTLLGWKVNGPTALDFVDHILAMDDASSNDITDVDESAKDTIGIIASIARMQAELSVADQSLASVPYSTVAVACIRNAMDEINYHCSSGDFQGLSSVMNVNPFSTEVDDVCAHLKQMIRDSATGAVLSRLSSELVCRVPSSKIPKPTLKREISSPTSVSRLSVTDRM